jgi:cytochrome b subunit of formate dehydrogenase
VRRGLHAAHAITTLLLVATGLLLEFPELRLVSTGGYGQTIVALHRWGGVAFAAAPLLALGLAASALAEELRRRLGPPDPWRWRKTHIVLTLVAVPALSASGFALWLDDALPRGVVDAARTVHVALTWMLIAALPVHLIAARRKIVQRVRGWLGLEPPIDAFFADDEEDERA